MKQIDIFMAQEPAFNDSWVNLWRKVARNWYDVAVSQGYAGTLEPNGLDNDTSSMRKAVFYTAWIAAGSASVAAMSFTYYRPGGVDVYFRPDGSSSYFST